MEPVQNRKRRFSKIEKGNLWRTRCGKTAGASGSLSNLCLDWLVDVEDLVTLYNEPGLPQYAYANSADEAKMIVNEAETIALFISRRSFRVVRQIPSRKLRCSLEICEATTLRSSGKHPAPAVFMSQARNCAKSSCSWRSEGSAAIFCCVCSKLIVFWNTLASAWSQIRLQIAALRAHCQTSCLILLMLRLPSEAG